MARFKFNLVPVVKQMFVKDDLVLDNMHFSDCEFEECNFLYSGGPTMMDHCGVRNCGWRMQGSAAIIVESLMKCGWQILPPGGTATMHAVSQFSDSLIRQPTLPQYDANGFGVHFEK
jgi:hypothetical protein